jgi:hypothetical protein
VLVRVEASNISANYFLSKGERGRKREGGGEREGGGLTSIIILSWSK